MCSKTIALLKAELPNAEISQGPDERIIVEGQIPDIDRLEKWIMQGGIIERVDKAPIEELGLTQTKTEEVVEQVGLVDKSYESEQGKVSVQIL